MSKSARAEALLERAAKLEARAETEIDQKESHSTQRRASRAAAEAKRIESLESMQTQLAAQHEQKQNVSVLSETIAGLRHTADVIEDRLDEIDDDREEVKKELDDLNARLAAAREEIAQCEELMPGVQGRFDTLERQKLDAEAELSTVQHDIDAKQRMVNDLEANMRAIMESFTDAAGMGNSAYGGNAAGTVPSEKWTYKGSFVEDEEEDEDDQASKRKQREARLLDRFDTEELSAEERRQAAQDRWTNVFRAIRRGLFNDGAAATTNRRGLSFAGAASGESGDFGTMEQSVAFGPSPSISVGGLAAAKSFARRSRRNDSMRSQQSTGVDPALFRTAQTEARLYRAKYTEAYGHYDGLRARYDHLHEELVTLRTVVAEYDGDTVEDLAAEIRFYKQERRRLYDKLYNNKPYEMPGVRRIYGTGDDDDDDDDGLLSKVAKVRANVAKMMKDNASNPDSVAFQAKVIDQLRVDKEKLTAVVTSASQKFALFRLKLENHESALMECHDEFLSGVHDERAQLEAMQQHMRAAQEKLMVSQEEERKAWNAQSAQYKDELHASRLEIKRLESAVTDAGMVSHGLEKDLRLEKELSGSLEKQIAALSVVFQTSDDYNAFDSAVHLVQVAKPELVANEESTGLSEYAPEVKEPLLSSIETMYHDQYTGLIELSAKIREITRSQLRKNDTTEPGVADLATHLRGMQQTAKKAVADVAKAVKRAITHASGRVKSLKETGTQCNDPSQKKTIRVGKTTQTIQSAVEFPPVDASMTAHPTTYPYATQTSEDGRPGSRQDGSGGGRGVSSDRLKALEETVKLKIKAAQLRLDEAERIREAAQDELCMQLNQRAENEHQRMQAQDVLATSWEMVDKVRAELAAAKAALEVKVFVDENDAIAPEQLTDTEGQPRRRYFRPRYIQTDPVVVSEVPDTVAGDRWANVSGSAAASRRASLASDAATGATQPLVSATGPKHEQPSRVPSRRSTTRGSRRRLSTASLSQGTPAESPVDSTETPGTATGRRGTSRRSVKRSNSSRASSRRTGSAANLPLAPGTTADAIPLDAIPQDDAAFDRAPSGVEGVHDSDFESSSASDSGDSIVMVDDHSTQTIPLQTTSVALSAAPDTASISLEASLTPEEVPTNTPAVVRPEGREAESQTELVSVAQAEVAIMTDPESTPSSRPATATAHPRVGSASTKKPSSAGPRRPSSSSYNGDAAARTTETQSVVEELTSHTAQLNRQIADLEEQLVTVTADVEKFSEAAREVDGLRQKAVVLEEDRDHWREEHDRLADDIASLTMTAGHGDAASPDDQQGDAPAGGPHHRSIDAGFDFSIAGRSDRSPARSRVASRQQKRRAPTGHFTLADVFDQIRGVKRENETLRMQLETDRNGFNTLKSQLETAEAALAAAKKGRDNEAVTGKQRESLLGAEVRALKERARQAAAELTKARDEADAMNKAAKHAHSVAERQTAALKQACAAAEKERDAAKSELKELRVSAASGSKLADDARDNLRDKQRSDAVHSAKELAHQRANNHELMAKVATLQRERDRAAEMARRSMSAEALERSAKAVSDAFSESSGQVHAKAFSIHRQITSLIMHCKNSLGLPVSLDDPAPGFSSAKLFIDAVERRDPHLFAQHGPETLLSRVADASSAVLQIQAADSVMVSTLLKVLQTNRRANSRMGRGGTASRASPLIPATDARAALYVVDAGRPGDRIDTNPGSVSFGLRAPGSRSGAGDSSTALGLPPVGPSARASTPAAGARDMEPSTAASPLSVATLRSGEHGVLGSSQRDPSIAPRSSSSAGLRAAVSKSGGSLVVRPGCAQGTGARMSPLQSAAVGLAGATDLRPQLRSPDGDLSGLVVGSAPPSPERDLSSRRDHAPNAEALRAAAEARPKDRPESGFAAFVAGRRAGSPDDQPEEEREGWNRGRHMYEIAEALESLPPRPASTIPVSSAPAGDLAANMSPGLAPVVADGLPRRVGTPSGPLAGRHRRVLWERSQARAGTSQGRRR